MSRTAFRALAQFLCGFLLVGVLTAGAKADVLWTVQPSSKLGATATLYIAAYDINNPTNTNPDPNSDTYVPPILITSIPQTDAGTSGDPALGASAVNSTFASGTGFFTTKGNTPTSSLNFGNPASPPSSALTVAATNVGSFYPSIIPTPNPGAAQYPTFGGNNQPVYHFGSLSTVNSAGSLQTQSPLTGYNALTGGDFADASRDAGRVAMYGLKALPVSTSAIPVIGGAFDASQLDFRGTLGLSLSLAMPMDPFGVEGIGPQSIVITPDVVGVSLVTNRLVGLSAQGSITRSGAGTPNTGSDYLMSLPFSARVAVSENYDRTDQLFFTLMINIVAKANILPGDVNFDGLVDATDRSIILSHLGQTSPDHLGIGDANGDGVVNTNDLQLVPEPATLIVFATGIVGLFYWRTGRSRSALVR